MNDLLIGLVGALLATNQPQAVSNLIQQNAGVSVTIPNPNDPAEKELHQLMIEDDAAMAEVDKWIRDNNAFAAQGAGESKEEFNRRIMARLDVVRKNYEDFLQRYPGFRARASGLRQFSEQHRRRGSGEARKRKGPATRSQKSGGLEQPRQLLRRTRPDHQRLRVLCQSH